MANELIVKEYSAAGHSEHGLSVSVYQEANLISSNFVSIGSESDAFDSDTEFVSLTAKVAMQYKFGVSGDAGAGAANTDDNSFIAAGQVLDFKIDGTISAVDTIADA